MSVYAIMGVQLFHSQQKDAFGSFGVSLYTMFAATTMDGWQVVLALFYIALHHVRRHHDGWLAGLSTYL